MCVRVCVALNFSEAVLFPTQPAFLITRLCTTPAHPVGGTTEESSPFKTISRHSENKLHQSTVVSKLQLGALSITLPHNHVPHTLSETAVVFGGVRGTDVRLYIGSGKISNLGLAGFYLYVCV